MKIKDRKAWELGLQNNPAPYGAACYKFAEAWADEMERRIGLGETLEQCADKASHDVDMRPGFGITGFMYGAAVSILSACWERGEELRRWHNLKTQLRDEGEKANESGGVLNPALLTVG